MIAHGKDIKIFSGTSNRPLAEAICASTRKCLSRNSLYKTDRIVQIWRGAERCSAPIAAWRKNVVF